jgi:hypothetical protein
MFWNVYPTLLALAILKMGDHSTKLRPFVILKGTVHVIRAASLGYSFGVNSSFQDDKGPELWWKADDG